VLAEVVWLASAARELCFSWGPQEHQSTYERIITAAMSYSAVVNYARAVEIPLLPCHPASSSSSASTAALQPTPATFADGFSARGHNSTHKRRARTPTCSGRLLPPDAGTFSRPYFQLMHTIIVCL
jgi:hypothetical protein